MARCRRVFLSAVVMTISCCAAPRTFAEGARNNAGGPPSPEEGHATPDNSSATCSGTEHGSATTPAYYDATEEPENLVAHVTEHKVVSRKLPAEHTHAPAAAVLQEKERHAASPATAAVATTGPAGIVESLAADVPERQPAPEASPATDKDSADYAAAAASAEYDELLANITLQCLDAVISAAAAGNKTDAARKVTAEVCMALLRALVSASTADDTAVAVAVVRVMQAPLNAAGLKNLTSLAGTSYPELVPQVVRLQQLVPAVTPVQASDWHPSLACTTLVLVLVLLGPLEVAPTLLILYCCLYRALFSPIVLALVSSVLFRGVKAIMSLRAVKDFVLARGAFHAFMATVVTMLVCNTVWMAVVVLLNIQRLDKKLVLHRADVVVWWAVCTHQAAEICTFFKVPVLTQILASFRKPQLVGKGEVK